MKEFKKFLSAKSVSGTQSPNKIGIFAVEEKKKNLLLELKKIEKINFFIIFVKTSFLSSLKM